MTKIPKWQFEVIEKRLSSPMDAFHASYKIDQYERQHDKAYQLPERFTARYLVKHSYAPLRDVAEIRKNVTNPCKGSIEYNCIFKIHEHPAYKHGVALLKFITNAKERINEEYAVSLNQCREHPEAVDTIATCFEQYIEKFRAEIKKRETAAVPMRFKEE